MANVIRLKRASGSDPTASDLVSGEPAVRTDTGELFFKKDDGSVAKVSGAGGGPDFKYLALRNAANNGAASYPNADFTLVTSGTTSAITPTAANTLLVSVNGVIQKPNTGTSTPSQGFALSGSTIKFGANLSVAPDFILYQESGGIGEPSDETVSEEKLKVSNSPVNGYFLSAQSGNNGGLTWAAPVATSCTGNSATATALATARTINGTSFDGTANITVTAAAGTLTGNTLNSSVTASSLTSLGDLSGLTVTGNMAVDTNTLFVNASTNRVGIGTSSPSRRLVVAGDTNTVISSIGATDGTSSIFLGDTDDEDIGALTYNHPSNFLSITTNASEAMRIDSSGRLLIGTTTEGHAQADNLTIADSADSGLTIRSGTGSQGAIFFSDATSGDGEYDGFVTYGQGSSELRFGTARATRLKISSSGHVLPAADSTYNIGSSSVRFANGYFDTLYGDGSNLTGINTDLVSDTSPQLGGPLNTNGQIIKWPDSSGSSVNRAIFGAGSDLQIYHDGSASYIDNTHSGGLYVRGGSSTGYVVALQAKNSENSVKCIGDGAVELYYDSSKKFETTSTGIHVNDSANNGEGSLKIGGQNTSTGATLFYEISGATYLRIKNLYRSNSSNGANAYIEYDGGYHKFMSGTGGTERLRITSTGMLEMRSDMSASDQASRNIFRFTDTDTSTTSNQSMGRLQWFSSDASGGGACVKAEIEAVAQDTTPEANLIFKTHTSSATSPTERMRITGDGNVGIGSTPTEKLEINLGTDKIVQFTGGIGQIGDVAGVFAVNTAKTEIADFGIMGNSLRFASGTALGGAERMRIDVNGNVGMGTSSPASYDGSVNNLVVQGSGNTGITVATTNTSSNTALVFADGTGDADSRFRGAVQYLHNGDVLRFLTGSAERARLTESGGLAVGTTNSSPGQGNGNTDVGAAVNSTGRFICNSSGSFSSFGRNDTGLVLSFTRQGGDQGGISVSVGAVSYGSGSDYRLKENVVSLTGAITRIKQLLPKRFNFIEDTTNTLRDGFLAHEVSSIVPEAITGTKDEVDSDNNPVYQQIDQAKLVPLLVAAVQELTAKVEALEAK